MCADVNQQESGRVERRRMAGRGRGFHRTHIYRPQPRRSSCSWASRAHVRQWLHDMPRRRRFGAQSKDCRECGSCRRGQPRPYGRCGCPYGTLHSLWLSVHVRPRSQSSQRGNPGSLRVDSNPRNGFARIEDTGAGPRPRPRSSALGRSRYIVPPTRQITGGAADPRLASFRSSTGLNNGGCRRTGCGRAARLALASKHLLRGQPRGPSSSRAGIAPSRENECLEG